MYALRYVEESEAAWSAQQLAAVEAEIESQKREWEEKRIAALRQEEETRRQNMRKDDDVLTFSREDSTNQVNSNVKNPNNRRIALIKNKRRLLRRNCSVISRRNRNRNNRNRNIKKSVKVEITKPNSPIKKSPTSSPIKSNSKLSSDSEISWDDPIVNNEESPIKTPQNIVNIVPEESPRTRSRGTVAINLWTLDVSPILPGVKPVGHSRLPNTSKPKSAERKKVVRNLRNKSVKFNDENDTITNGVESDPESEITPKVSSSDIKTDLSNETKIEEEEQIVTSTTGESNNGTLTPPPAKRTFRLRGNKDETMPSTTKSNKQTLDSWLIKTPRNHLNGKLDKVVPRTSSPVQQQVHQVHQVPYANPNFVIRTRRASVNPVHSELESLKRFTKTKNLKSEPNGS